MRGRRDQVFSSRGRRHWGRWVLVVLVAALLACGLYTALDNGRLHVKAQRVLTPDLPAALEGFTVLHISDLGGARFGPQQKQLANIMKNQRYDAVCVTGGMVGKNGDAYPFYELLAALDPTKPVYFIAADTDPTPVGGQSAGYYTVLADWISGAQTRGAVYLDAPASLTVGKATVWFSDASQIGLDLDSAIAAYAASSSAEADYWLDAMERTAAARERMRPEDLHVVLSSPPLARESVLTWQNTADQAGSEQLRSIDLVLSGGTAGGQWRLPGVGPVWANGRWWPGEEAVSGYHYAGSLLQYISGGLNVSPDSPLPGFRLFNTPELTLITFTSKIDGEVLP